MFAKMISAGIAGSKPKPGNCFTGEIPEETCIMIGGIPAGTCEKGYG
jgi:hypothetical protein